MKITRENYESWFLDYLEGQLDEGMTDEFIRFVQENSDLKEELTGFEMISLQPPVLSFQGKLKLKKDFLDFPDEFERAATACMEGDLNLAGKNHFEEYLKQHPEKQEEARLFRLTRLVADPTVVYPRKNELYHTPVIRLVIRRTMHIAAIMLGATLLFALFRNPSVVQGPGTEVAQTENLVNHIETQNPVEIFSVTENINEQEHESGFATAATAATEKEPANPAFRPVSQDEKSDRENHELTADRPVNITPVPPIRQIVLEVTSDPFSRVLASATPGENLPEAETKPEFLHFNEFILEKTGLSKTRESLNDLSISKVARFGIKLAANLSNDKFSYHTNEEGEITAFNLDTRLVGLSIPVGKSR